MENKIINLTVVAEVAAALHDILDQVVFVGGAVVSLYTDDPAADEIRPTADIDLTFHAVGIVEWSKTQKKLAELGFHPDPFGHSICSYKYKDIPVDFMSAQDGPMGPANKWYSIGFNDIHNVEVEGQNIQIFSAPCYLATKLEAFKDRGNDWRTSHDIEDVIYVLDNRTTIVDEILNAEDSIKAFLIEMLVNVKNEGMMDEVLLSHIHPLMVDERMPIVQEKIDRIINSQKK